MKTLIGIFLLIAGFYTLKVLITEHPGKKMFQYEVIRNHMIQIDTSEIPSIDGKFIKPVFIGGESESSYYARLMLLIFFDVCLVGIMWNVENWKIQSDSF